MATTLTTIPGLTVDIVVVPWVLRLTHPGVAPSHIPRYPPMHAHRHGYRNGRCRRGVSWFDTPADFYRFLYP